MADITQTLLTSGSSETDASSYSTASHTPSSNKLVLAFVNGIRFDAAASVAPTASGNGLTWVEVATQGYNNAGADRARITCFRAMGGSPSAGATTFTFTNTQLRCSWIIVEFDNVNTGGADGADAVVQAVTAEFADAATSTPSVTLAAFADAANATYGGIGTGFPAVTHTEGSGFTEVAEVATGSGTDCQVEFRLDNDTSVDWTLSAARMCACLGIEIANASTGRNAGAHGRLGQFF